MLHICKDLASKCFDWRGVGRGAEWRHPNVSNSQNRRSPRDFGSGPHPFDCARPHAAQRPIFDLSKSAYQTGAPRHWPISNHSPIWTSWVYVTVDTADCDENL
jgi:hypothetical protein